MTVSSDISRVEHAGNGATTAFSVPFYFIKEEDLKVVLRIPNGDGTNTNEAQTLNGDYTVTGASDEGGGTITFGVAPASNDAVVVYRDPELVQEAAYTPNGRFPAKSHERALDRSVMISQRLKDMLTRAIRLDDADEIGNGVYDLRGNRLGNASDPIDDQDVITKGWAVAQPGIVLGDITSAKAAAVAAASTATGAASTAATAASNATSAATTAANTAVATATTFTPSGSNGVSIPYLNKLRESVSITDFKCADGTSPNLFDPNSGTPSAQDHTLAITRALAAAYEVRVPTGGTLSATAITMPAGRSIVGPRGVTNINARDSVQTVVTMGANCHIDNLHFTSPNGTTARTGGKFIDIPSGAPNCILENVRMTKGYDGLRNAADVTQILGLYAREFDGGGHVIHWVAGYLGYIDRFLTAHNPAAMPQANLFVEATADLSVSNSNICQGGADLWIAPGNGQEVSSFKAVNTYFDSANYGAKIAPTGTGKVYRSQFTGCWFGGHTQDGAVLTTSGFGGTIDGILFAACEFLGNAGNGLNLIGANTKNTEVDGGRISGTTSAALAVFDSKKTRLGGALVIGPYGAFGGNGYAGFFGGAADDIYIAAGVDLRGNSAGVAVGTATNVVNNGRT